MKIDLIQGSPEWHAFRAGKIGGSDAPCIMGTGFKTARQLWHDKLGLNQNASSYAMQRGLEMEPLARAALEEEVGMPLEPSVWVSDRRLWMMASIDAASPQKSFVAEIKCPGKEDHGIALQGTVPEKYYPQLQHQIEVCELDYIYYWSFDGVQGKLIRVDRDAAYIEKLIEAEERFYQWMQNFEEPPLTDKDYIEQSSAEWKALAEEWLYLQPLVKKEKELRESLIKLAAEQNSYGYGVKLTNFTKKGNIDYSAIPDLKKIDLEIYRKSPVSCWKLTAA